MLLLRYNANVAGTTHTKNPSRLSYIGIVRNTPSILDRGQIWFEKNAANIRKEAKNPLSWWHNNYLELEQDRVWPLSELARRLADWGYIKTTSVHAPASFASRGGVIDVFPLNSSHAVRIEYHGNTIVAVHTLANITVDPQQKLRDIAAQPTTLALGKDAKKIREHEYMLSTLAPKAFVVHVDHGIGVFRGIVRKGHDEYLKLEYASGDTLYIPKSALGRVTPYVGFAEPVLTRLGGNLWEKTKRKVREDLIKTARELVAIYAERELAHRTPYRMDESLISLIEGTFPYQETDDQQATIDAIFADLASDRPMDRIICGDVGFGKTEVALRAAAYAVSAGKQVAFIAPTTILAHQHYKTLLKRFNNAQYPVAIEKLTRIENPKEQKRVREALAKKRCDIVVGTHRLLQKDIVFSELGLLIIDEEQRFGVKQKEYFKGKRSELDVLSLSATPIPRTLSFALSGLRDISIIATPPLGRRPIHTVVRRWDKKLVTRAIKQELARGGQVYYLHNRILSLPKTVAELRALAPQARIDFMHAKLPEHELIAKIDRFAEGDIDVLVSTTIMENGLDLANANTLIVDDAARLGLAQAHQIRGRIGRSAVQAYAYFLYPSRTLAEKPKMRLTALVDSQFLGAGYQIALRDMEIRGAGNFLGREQSGHIARVGFNLYCQLLNDAIEEIRNSA